MAVCLAQVAKTRADLMTDEALDDIAARFLAWAEHGASGPVARRMTQVACEYADRSPRSAGNGALMRTSVVGLTALDDRQHTARSARAIAALTHADPLPGDSCVLWSEAVRVAVVDGRLDVRSGLVLLPSERQQQWADWLDDVETLPASTFQRNGFTVTALQAAWSAIRHTHVSADDPAAGVFAASHFEETLQAALPARGRGRLWDAARQVRPLP